MSPLSPPVDRFELAQAYRETAQTGVLANYWKRRWQRSQEMEQWLQQEALPALTERQVRTLYRASGGSRISEFSANSLADISDTIDFLLFDTITLEARFNECASEAGAYYLAGAGKEFISYLLCLRQPDLLAVWNTSAERALRRLGRYPGSMGKGHLGLRYMDLLEATNRLRPEYGLADFREVDEFCYFVNRRAQAESRNAPGNSQKRSKNAQS
ncbi:MAG: hypothetical protein OXI91_06795 [Chloroflexota bacterium]|nr:hypothetical protein [Chloroflexota bacterium]